MEPISLDSLQGWWENPYSQNGIGMQYVKGNEVFIGNAPIKDGAGKAVTIKIGAGRKVKFGEYSGVVKPDGQEISWDNNKIIWTHLGELPDMHDPETKVGRFKYTKLLGKGANGVVCEAIDMSAVEERKVAVKILRLSTLSNKREIYKSALRLHFEYLWSHMFLHNKKHKHFNSEHANLFLQYFEDHTGLPPAPRNMFLASDIDLLNQSDTSHKVARIPYVLMELAKGETSWKVFFEKEEESARRFSTRDKRDVFRQMVSALAYLRKFDLVHRDLNFHNVFVSRSKGRLGVAIGDLGMMGSRTQVLTFAPGDEESWIMRDWVPWEAWHIPPTVTTNGRHQSPHQRAQSPAMPVRENAYKEENWQAFDIFSCGVVHLYMCLGQLEARRILQHIRLQNPSPPLNGSISRRLLLDSDLALGMICKDPDERPMPGEVLEGLQSESTFWSILMCPSRACSGRAAPARQNRTVSRSRSRSRSRYLPMELNGNRVLVKEGANTWKVTMPNVKKKPNTAGLGHRRSKNLDDHIIGGQSMVKWGERVSGFDEGDGWVRFKTEAPA